MGGLSNYRSVGKFDVLEAPRNPIGAFDAEQFKVEAMDLFNNGSNFIVVDLGNLDYLYSDAFNAFSTIHQKLDARSGTLGILAQDELAVKSLQQAGVDRYVKVFRREPELMAATLQAAPPEQSRRQASVVDSQSSAASIAPPVTTAAVAPAVAPAVAEPTPLRRTHRFTQSFNSSLNSPEENNELKGLPNAFDTNSLTAGTGGSGKWILGGALLLLIAGGVVWFLMQNGIL